MYIYFCKYTKIFYILVFIVTLFIIREKQCSNKVTAYVVITSAVRQLFLVLHCLLILGLHLLTHPFSAGLDCLTNFGQRLVSGRHLPFLDQHLIAGETSFRRLSGSMTCNVCDDGCSVS